ncbi:GNAT family protein [Micromonospora sp. BRA006-A]|nr:GNAT family protein [Micromonospora sp. BRA006-A]
MAAGFLSYRQGQYGGRAPYWEIGIVLLPEWRGRGLGWRAQALLCDYLFSHTPAQRIQAGTHPENVAEQRSLEKAGFQLEGSCGPVSSGPAPGGTGGSTAGCATTRHRCDRSASPGQGAGSVPMTASNGVCFSG